MLAGVRVHHPDGLGGADLLDYYSGLICRVPRFENRWCWSGSEPYWPDFVEELLRSGDLHGLEKVLWAKMKISVQV